MANSESTDLMSLGQHCAEPSCGQVDFLPFRCDCCQKTFCLEHRTYASHKCPKAGSKQTETIVCPLCARGIRLSPGEDPNQAFETHQQTGCDTRNYARVHKKPVCPVEGCREKLNAVNKLECKSCGMEVCLKHRLPADHKCSAILTNSRAGRHTQWSLFSTSRPPAQSSRTTSKTQRNLSCQECGARFSRSEELKSHQEAYHRGGIDRPGSFGGCPHCGRVFHDLVQLVDHVESKRCQQRNSTCAIS